jgi:hypothetical protein
MVLILEKSVEAITVSNYLFRGRLSINVCGK